MVWHFSLLLMDIVNKTDSAIFPIQTMLPKVFFFLSDLFYISYINYVFLLCISTIILSYLQILLMVFTSLNVVYK